MEKATAKTVFICQKCGRESLKWLGRCPGCQEWNTYSEKATAAQAQAPLPIVTTPPRQLSEVSAEQTLPYRLPLGEFNRVLGDGLVPGSLVLIGGDPGIGKSTLLLQVSALMAQAQGRVVYASGEETAHQIKLRGTRLGVSGENLYVVPETDIDSILSHAENIQPGMVVIDSIQTVSAPGIEGIPGSVQQVRECCQRLMRWAKVSGVPVLLSGHVTKDGAIAGPKVLEHMVDVVLYLEGEQFSSYRLLRSIKNRFGSTNEIGVFEMKAGGLEEVQNPSLAFLAQRSDDAVGSTVVPTMEGSRPLLVEIQALTSVTAFGLPRRAANGVDFNRLLMIIAVLSRRVGLRLGNQDVMVNAAGGLKVNEPGADLGIALAIASNFRDSPAPQDMVVMGEVGLSGELRAVPQLERRVSEAARLGFKRCLIPKSGARFPTPDGMEVIRVATLREAVAVGMGERFSRDAGRPIRDAADADDLANRSI